MTPAAAGSGGGERRRGAAEGSGRWERRRGVAEGRKSKKVRSEGNDEQAQGARLGGGDDQARARSSAEVLSVNGGP